METVNEKYSRLRAYLDCKTKADVIVAFSGGADSSLLLKMTADSARMHGTTVYAVTVHTRLHPAADMETAKKVAEETGAVHHILEINELAEAGIENNPVNRCYLCKKSIFQKIRLLAETLCVPCILEGTNEDDLHEYRPGIAALKELGIESPLALCGLTKKEVRELAARLGVSVAMRPANPCLATRFPYGETISYENMAKVEAGELLIREYGFYNVRLRLHGDVARIEVDNDDIEKIIFHRKEMVQRLKKLGFVYITVDLEGFRSGSMDVYN